MEIMKIIEIIVGVCSVFGLVWAGIFIGKEFGTFEKFFLAILDKLREGLKKNE